MFSLKKKVSVSEGEYNLTSSQQEYFDILEQMNPDAKLRKAINSAKKSLSALPDASTAQVDPDTRLDPISRSYAALTGDVGSTSTNAVYGSPKLKEAIENTYGMFNSFSEERLPNPSGSIYNFAGGYSNEIDYEAPSNGLIYGTLKSNHLLEKGHYLRLSSFNNEIIYYTITQIERMKNAEEDFARYDFIAKKTPSENLANKNFYYYRPFHDRDDVFGFDNQRIIFSWSKPENLPYDKSDYEDWD